MMEALKALLPLENAVFNGGLGLGLMGAAVAVGRKSLRGAHVLARRHLLSTLEVTSKDRSYPWVLNWVTAQSQTRQLGVRAVQHLSVNTTVREATAGRPAVQFAMVPGPGVHILRYKNSWLGVERTRETTMLDLNSGRPWEKISFTAFGKKTKLFASILDEAEQLAARAEDGKLIVYTNWGSEWRPFGSPRRRRPLDSVILDGGVAERILADVADWCSNEQWYRQRGIPYRRGYLLHGTPGSGKTSFITALAGWLQYNVCVLNLSESGLTDDRLALAMTVVPPGSIILLEDIDAAFVQRSADSCSITFSGLLNTLDGIASSEERLVFMTTNHIDRLDPALIRPGRVDVVEFLGNASSHQRKQLFAKFFPEHVAKTPTLPEDFDAAIVKHGLDGELSMARIQGYLLCYKHDPLASIDEVPKLKQEVEMEMKSQARVQAAAAASDASPPQARRRGSRGRLSAADVDRVMFNPQDGWEQAHGISNKTE